MLKLFNKFNKLKEEIIHAIVVTIMIIIFSPPSMEKLTKVLQDLKGSIRDNYAVRGVVRSCSGHGFQESRGKDGVEDQGLGVLPN